jgi:serine/threonine protein phosphatase 1
LELTREIGDYLFVHAGINPYEPLQNQTSEDFLWIRGEFLEAEIEYGVVVVHGHSYTGEPAVKNNRICVDTGAYASNKLTCVVLEDTSHRFLST